MQSMGVLRSEGPRGSGRKGSICKGEKGQVSIGILDRCKRKNEGDGNASEKGGRNEVRGRQI